MFMRYTVFLLLFINYVSNLISSTSCYSYENQVFILRSSVLSYISHIYLGLRVLFWSGEYTWLLHQDDIMLLLRVFLTYLSMVILPVTLIIYKLVSLKVIWCFFWCLSYFKFKLMNIKLFLMKLLLSINNRK